MVNFYGKGVFFFFFNVEMWEKWRRRRVVVDSREVRLSFLRIQIKGAAIHGV